MKRGYAGDFVPLLPAMLAGAAMDQGDGSAQPAEPHHTPVDPLPSTSLPPIPSSPLQSPPHSPLQSPPHSPLQSPPHSPTFITPTSLAHQSPPYSTTSYSSPRTKQTLGNVMLKLVKKVKSLEIALKRKSKKVEQGHGKKHKILDWMLNDAINTSRDEIIQLLKMLILIGRAIRMQAQMDEEVAKQIHLDKMVAKRVQGRTRIVRATTERKQSSRSSQFYLRNDWDTIRVKLEANTVVVKSLQGESISNDDFAKRMVEMINEKKKFYAEQKAKAKRS
ncbi:hypothetical protein Tco_0720710 [Tanacetum coccineum]